MRIPLKILVILAINNSISYKDIAHYTNYHLNTVSRYITILERYNMIKITHVKSNNLRGKKWVNIVSLKPELQNLNMKIFFESIAKSMKTRLDDLFIG